MDLAYEFAPATESDREVVCDLNLRCYRELVVRQFGEWDEAFQRSHFDRKWGESTYRKIMVGGEMAGVLVVENHEDHVFLSEIQIDPGQQGRGLGRRVVSDLIEKAEKAGLPVRLRVLLQNRAKRLYERLGFVVTDRTETHYLMTRT